MEFGFSLPSRGPAATCRSASSSLLVVCSKAYASCADRRAPSRARSSVASSTDLCAETNVVMRYAWGSIRVPPLELCLCSNRRCIVGGRHDHSVKLESRYHTLRCLVNRISVSGETVES